jgi:hypothetical protein
MRRLLIPILGLIMLGCGVVQLYPGPALPAAAVAVLEIGNVTVHAFDGIPPNRGNTKKLQILPGEHVVRASHQMEGYDPIPITYTFTAEPGHAYLFSADYRIERTLSWRPWIKDAANGTIVGSWR